MWTVCLGSRADTAFSNDGLSSHDWRRGLCAHHSRGRLWWGCRYLQYILKLSRTSVAKPESGAFLTPGIRIRDKFFPDPGSRIHNPYFSELVTFFGVNFVNLYPDQNQCGSGFHNIKFDWTMMIYCRILFLAGAGSPLYRGGRSQDHSRQGESAIPPHISSPLKRMVTDCWIQISSFNLHKLSIFLFQHSRRPEWIHT